MNKLTLQLLFIGFQFYCPFACNITPYRPQLWARRASSLASGGNKAKRQPAKPGFNSDTNPNHMVSRDEIEREIEIGQGGERGRKT